MASSMYTNLTNLYANGNNPGIIGRDREIKMLFLTLLRSEKPNALLSGPPGVGKTSIVDHLAYLISNNMCPNKLRGFNVVSIQANALIAGPGYRGVTEDKFQAMIDTALTSGKTVLFYDEFHTIEHLGEMANGQTPGLGNTLKPYLTRDDFRMIGATTLDDLKKMTDRSLLRRFYNINVTEPSDEAILDIIRRCIIKYGKGLNFKKEVVQQILDLSKSIDGYNPDKAKDIADLLCSYCNLEEIKEVNDQIVSYFFDTFYMKVHKEKEVEKQPEAQFI